MLFQNPPINLSAFLLIRLLCDLLDARSGGAAAGRPGLRQVQRAPIREILPGFSWVQLLRQRHHLLLQGQRHEENLQGDPVLLLQSKEQPWSHLWSSLYQHRARGTVWEQWCSWEQKEAKQPLPISINSIKSQRCHRIWWGFHNFCKGSSSFLIVSHHSVRCVNICGTKKLLNKLYEKNSNTLVY